MIITSLILLKNNNNNWEDSIYIYSYVYQILFT
jgi:hypothetical protein